jgi:hypothetical protein
MRINFKFLGGPNDGRVFRGRLGEASDAERYYMVTHHGTVGQRFKVASPYAVETLAEELLNNEKPHQFQRHFYVVSDHVGDADEVWITAEYRPDRAL